MFTFWLLLDILAIVSMFGFGIALNMVFRRWWISPILFVILTVYAGIRSGFLWSAPEWGLYAISLIGVIGSVWGVFALKRGGYSIFQ